MQQAKRNTWLGIDIGAGSTKLAVMDAQGEVRATALSDAYDLPDPCSLSKVIERAIVQLGEFFDNEEVEAIGIALPGVMEADGKTIAQCGNLPAMDGLDVEVWVRAIVERAIVVRVVTDQHAAAAAEYAANPQPGRTLFLALGTGVGGAVLDDGEPITITRGTPGHLGHLDVSGGDHDAPMTSAAGRGALEAYVGASALRAAGLVLEDPARCAQHPAMSGAVDALARGLRIMFAMYRMDHIVLLGGVAPVFGPVLDSLEKRIRDGLTPVAPSAWTLTLGNVGYYAGAIGAAQLARRAS